MFKSATSTLGNGVAKFFWYDLINDSPDGSDHEGNFGLYGQSIDGVAALPPKKAAFVYGLLIEQLGGLKAAGEANLGGGARITSGAAGANAVAAGWTARAARRSRSPPITTSRSSPPTAPPPWSPRQGRRLGHRPAGRRVHPIYRPQPPNSSGSLPRLRECLTRPDGPRDARPPRRRPQTHRTGPTPFPRGGIGPGRAPPATRVCDLDHGRRHRPRPRPAAWVASALTVKNELEAAQRLIGTSGDSGASAADRLRDIGAHATAASDAAGDPLWHLAGIRADRGRQPAGRPRGERVDRDARRRHRRSRGRRDERRHRRRSAPSYPHGPRGEGPRRRRDGLDGGRRRQFAVAFIGPVRTGIDQVDDVMRAAGPALSAAPALLGADGVKNYLLVFQDNAEVVPLGGSAASQTLVSADDGAISSRAGVEHRLPQRPRRGRARGPERDRSLRQLPPRSRQHHTEPPGLPDRGTPAERLQRDIRSDQIDGVVSVDPIALGRILEATGPITVGDIEITSKNATQVLLKDVYAKWDPSKDKSAGRRRTPSSPPSRTPCSRRSRRATSTSRTWCGPSAREHRERRHSPLERPRSPDPGPARGGRAARRQRRQTRGVLPRARPRRRSTTTWIPRSPSDGPAARTGRRSPPTRRS